LDRRIGVVGLEALANAAGGYLFTINGAGSGVFERLQAELSGYYLVGIQPDPRDRDGKGTLFASTCRGMARSCARAAS
jgi:hypothetical protein